MPDLVYDPALFPLTSTSTVEASGLRDLTYDETTPAQSWSVINGLLDADNFDAGLLIQREHVQRGAWVDGGGAAGTANLDYRWTWFGDYDSGGTWDGTEANISQARAIPGGCVSFHLPKAALVRLAWTVMWTNDNNFGAPANYKTNVFLKTSNSSNYTKSQVRFVGRVDTTAGGVNHEGYQRNRVWSGHHVINMNAGYNSAGLRILSDNNIRQARVWARSMIWVRM